MGVWSEGRENVPERLCLPGGPGRFSLIVTETREGHCSLILPINKLILRIEIYLKYVLCKFKVYNMLI